MCQITGGPCFYIGKDMLSVHKDLNITRDEWAALMEIAASQTTDWKIKSSDKKEFLTLFDNIKELMKIHKS
jgi:hemoglobin